MRLEYDRLVAEWLAAGRPTSTCSATDITVAELLRRFKAFADRHYVKDGKPSGEVTNLEYALKPVREFYADTLARDFRPLALKAIQQGFVAAGILLSGGHGEANSSLRRLDSSHRG